jgi:hypothetical protein
MLFLQDEADERSSVKGKAAAALLNSTNSSNPAAAGSKSSSLDTTMLNGGSSSSPHTPSSLILVPDGAGKSSQYMLAAAAAAACPNLQSPLIVEPEAVGTSAAMPDASSMPALPAGPSSIGCLPSDTPPLHPKPGQLGAMCGLAKGGSSHPAPNNSAAAASSMPEAPRSRRRTRNQVVYREEEDYEEYEEEEEDAQPEYEVERIVDHRFRRDGTMEYRVKWLGYGNQHMTWQSQAECANCTELITEYFDSCCCSG